MSTEAATPEPWRFESRNALAAKIEWEGGLMDALDYGITTEMMPEGDAELTEAWSKLEASFKETAKLADAVSELLPDSARAHEADIADIITEYHGDAREASEIAGRICKLMEGGR